MEKREVRTGGACGHHCNTKSNDRGRRLLELASPGGGKHIWPTQNIQKNHLAQPRRKTHNQNDYIMVQKRFKSSVNIAKTRCFPGADIGSHQELVMMTFKLHLKRAKKTMQHKDQM